MAYFKKLMKNSMQLEIDRTNEKFGQYNSMVHLEDQDYQTNLMGNTSKLNKVLENNEKLKSISSQKLFQITNKILG